MASYILTKIFFIKLHLYAKGFTPINIIIFFLILRILYLIFMIILRNDFELEFFSYLNSFFKCNNLYLERFNFYKLINYFINTDSKINSKLSQDISMYITLEMKDPFMMDISREDIPYKLSFKEITNKFLSGAYYMENNSGERSSDFNQDLSNIASQALARLNPDKVDVSTPSLPKLDLPNSNLNRSDLTKSDLPRPELARSHLHRLGLHRPTLPRLDLLGPSKSNMDSSTPNIPRTNVFNTNTNNSNLSSIANQALARLDGNR